MRPAVPEFLFENANYLAIAKPAGWLTIPDRFDPHFPNLYRWLLQNHGSVYIVHRLDKDTSGIVIFAKTREAHRHLCMQFAARTIKKIYVAILCGVPETKEGTISLPVATDPRQPGRMRIHPQGKPARTDYRVIETFRHYALAEAYPQTGRTHQVRIHFAAIHHPLVADPLYGTPRGIYLSDIKMHYRPKAGEEEKPLINRLALHAQSLIFTQPNGDTLELTAEKPKDFRSALNHLRKYEGR